jgi:hypothetical protein
MLKFKLKFEYELQTQSSMPLVANMEFEYELQTQSSMPLVANEG